MVGNDVRLAAVAVMAKVPGATPVKSRLQPTLTPERATELYRCFLLDRLDGVAGIPGIAPVVAFTPPEAREAMAQLAPASFRLVPQEGENLGERLSRLLSRLLADGHGAAMAIDSDSPTLPMAYVRDAADILAAGDADAVLGPCEDGGYYLVGLRASQPALFDDIPWSTERVLSVTLERARALGLATHLLKPWFDVDTESDLRRLHREMSSGEARRTFAFLRSLFG